MQNTITNALLFLLFIFSSCNKKEEVNNTTYKANVAGNEISFSGQITATRYLDIRDNVPVAYNYVIQNTESPLLYISVIDSLTSNQKYSYPNISVIYSVMENDTLVNNYYQDHSDEGYFNIYKEENNILIADFYFVLLKKNTSEILILKDGKIEIPIQYLERKWNH